MSSSSVPSHRSELIAALAPDDDVLGELEINARHGNLIRCQTCAHFEPRGWCLELKIERSATELLKCPCYQGLS